jgi:hypothetical protein
MRRMFYTNRWAVSLAISLVAIILGYLVREGIFTIDLFKRQTPQATEEAPEKAPEPINNNEKKSDLKSPLQSNNHIQSEKHAEESADVSANSPSPLVKLQTELSKKLNESGFTSYESEQAFKIISDTFKENAGKGTDSIALALDKAAKTLSLNDARKDMLKKALFDSFSETGGSFTTDEFQSCIERRKAVLKPDQCSQDLMDQFVAEISAAAQGYEKITLQMQKEYSNIQDRYVQLSTQCKLDPLIAGRLFAPMLSDCPLHTSNP